LRKYKEQAARAKRTGGEYRGNAYDRKRSRQQLVNEFGDGEHCRCWMCGRVLTPDNVTRDKIVVGAQGGRYTQDNLLPACGRCNDSRNDKPVLPALRATLRALGG
jgi:5-methylcytosine-specific restriction endonuclease McrA